MSILLGFMAALCWGVHDIFVRFVTQRVEIYTALCTVFFVSTILLFGLIWVTDTSFDLKDGAVALSGISGVTFALASVSLYKAFAIGPVRLVAPIIGAYPILSLIWAVLQGATVGVGQLLAVVAVIAGVAFVATVADKSDHRSEKSHAILWSGLACMLFSICFAVGQAAAPMGSTLMLNFIIRLSALIVFIILGLLTKNLDWPTPRVLPVLGILSLLDTIGFALVTGSGHYKDPQYASVGASTFGMITIILAWIFLKERLNRQQWLAVSVVFGAVLYLGL
jgi:drug/metabolite transporter (DMT)-like permease